MRVRGWIVGGVALAVLWAFVRGVAPAPEPVADTLVGRALAGIAADLLAGLLVGLPTAFLFRRTLPDRVDLRRSVAVLPPTLVYAATFLRELVVATIDVTYRVVAPGPPIDPEVLYVPLRVESDLAVTTIANTITLTPGTIALDHDPAGNALYVHVIDGRNVDAVVRPIRTWEDNALAIFGESASPTDRPPQVLVTGDEVDERGELRPAGSEAERGSGDSDSSGGSDSSGATGSSEASGASGPSDSSGASDASGATGASTTDEGSPDDGDAGSGVGSDDGDGTGSDVGSPDQHDGGEERGE